jgi:transcriptional regulator with XRE-family HTH domain
MNSPDVNKKLDKGFQSDLARRMGITRQAVSEIFTGKRIPGGKMAKRLEEATGVPHSCWLYPDIYPNPLIKKAPDGNGTSTPA